MQTQLGKEPTQGGIIGLGGDQYWSNFDLTVCPGRYFPDTMAGLYLSDETARLHKSSLCWSRLIWGVGGVALLFLVIQLARGEAAEDLDAASAAICVRWPWRGHPGLVPGHPSGSHPDLKLSK